MPKKRISRLSFRDRWQSGATSIEYGLIAAFVALSIYVGAIVAGEGVSGIFSAMTNQIEYAMRNE